MSISTCQFCERCNNLGHNQPRRAPLKYNGKVKYGTRHYAHFECFLEHKGIGAFNSLTSFQQGQFPYKLLESWGIIARAESL
jgi:hypothetical protein